MTGILSFCFFALFATILLNVTESLSPKFKGFLLAGAGIVLFLLFLRYIQPIFQTLSDLSNSTALPDLFQLVWKALGISFLVSLCASFCRDLGEEGIAGKLEMCGKGAVLSLSLPVLKSILELIGDFLT